MPVTTPPTTAFNYRSASGSISELPTTEVVLLGTIGNEYQTGIANLSKPTVVMQAGGRIGQTEGGDVVRLIHTVYDPSLGEVQVEVTYQDNGLKEGDEALTAVEAEVVGAAPVDATTPAGPQKISIQEYLALSLQERASGNYSVSSSGVAASDYQVAAPIAAQPPSTHQSYGSDYQPQQYVPSSQPYYDPSQGAQQAPSPPPSGQGSGPDPANPYGGDQPRGPNLADPSYAQGFL